MNQIMYATTEMELSSLIFKIITLDFFIVIGFVWVRNVRDN